MRLLALCALLATGCGSLLSFDVSQQATTTIPGSGPFAPLNFTGFNNLTFNNNTAFQNQNTDKNHISECRLTKLTLKVTNPPGNDLSFFKTVDFTISAPNLPDQHIAGGTSFPAGATSVDLALDNVDIAPYVKSDTFSIKTAATGTSPSQTTDVEADMVLHVHASLL